MLRFKDVRPKFNIRQMEPRYFDKLNRYIEHVSYGKTRIRGDIKGWYTLPEPVNAYRISRHNLEVDKDRIRKLVQDKASIIADRDVDFSAYDFVLISLGARARGLRDDGLLRLPGAHGMEKRQSVRDEKRPKNPGRSSRVL